MAHLLRPLLLSPKPHHHLHHLLRRRITALFNYRHLPTITTSTSPPNLHLLCRGLRSSAAPTASAETDEEENVIDSDGDTRKSRNEKKREARRAVKWGMELASFSDNQIKRILRVVEAGDVTYNAIMLVKRLGRDVREGKRRQFNYIGRLLREVKPELMDGLIQATKDGDQEKFRDLTGSETWDVGTDAEEAEEIDSEDENEGPSEHLDTATRWFDGLINKDANITKEIYSLSMVDYDRQELRKLVRNSLSLEGRQVSEVKDGQEDAALLRARRSLNRFLVAIAKQLPIE